MSRSKKSTVVKFFSARTLPPAYRKQLTERKGWDTLCGKQIPFAVSKNAVPAAQIIGLVLKTKRKNNKKKRKSGKKKPMEVLAFLFGLTHLFMTDLDGKRKPVAKKNEWYIDLVCSSGKQKGMGSRLINAFINRARQRKITAIRLYSVDAKILYWKDKMGFVECDVPCGDRAAKCTRKRYKKDPQQGVRMTKCVN